MIWLGCILHENAFDICSRFLDRNPETRLGSSSFEDIKNHPWFACIDWEKLCKREMIPPFKPMVHGKEDVGNIDNEFLQEVPTVTPTLEGKPIVNQELFDGFSFDPAKTS